MVLAHARAWLDTDPTSALAWIREYPPDGANLEEAARIAVEAYELGTAEDVLKVTKRAVYQVAVSPNGKNTAFLTYEPVVNVWESSTRRLRQFPARPIYYRDAVGFSPGGSGLYVATRDDSVLAFDLVSGTLRSLGDASSPDQRSLVVSPDGRHVAVALASGDVDLWEVATGKRTTLTGHEAPVGVVTWVDARTLASGSDDRTVRLWDVESGDVRILRGHSDEVWDLEADAGLGVLASGSIDGTVRFWDLETGQQTATCTGLPTREISFSMGGKGTVAIASDDPILRVCRPSGEVEMLEGHRGAISAVALSKAGDWLASADASGELRLWDLVGRDHRVLAGHLRRIYDVELAASGDVLVSGARDGEVRRWPVPARRSFVRGDRQNPVQAAVRFDDGMLALAEVSGRLTLFARGSRQEAASHPMPADDTVAVYRVGEDQLVRVGTRSVARWRSLYGELDDWLPLDSDDVVAASVEADGRMLAVLTRGKQVHVIDTRTGAVSAATLPCAGEARRVAIGGEQTQVLAACSSGELYTWAKTSSQPRLLGQHKDSVGALAISNTQIAVSGAKDGEIREWDLTEGTHRVLSRRSESILVCGFRSAANEVWCGDVAGYVWKINRVTGDVEVVEYADAIRAIAFSPDGKRAAIASREKTIGLWDLETRTERKLKGHDQTVDTVAFSADSRYLTSVSSDQTARVWSLDGLQTVPRAYDELAEWIGSVTSVRADLERPNSHALTTLRLRPQSPPQDSRR